MDEVIVMSRQIAYFHTQHRHPDYQTLRDQLNQLDGIHSMEINYLDHGVTVNYDNGCLPYDWLQNRMGAIGYLPKEL